MSVSLEYLERCSAETGLPVAGLEKVVRLGEMAAEVVGPSAGWPGGRESWLHPWVKPGHLVKREGPALIASPWNAWQGSDDVRDPRHGC